MLRSIGRYPGGWATVQLQADSAEPSTGSGEATLGLPGRYCRTVAPGTTWHAAGTWRSSPDWNVVTSEPGVTAAGPGRPPTSSTTASTAPAATTTPPALTNHRRRLRAAARSARPPGRE